MPAIPTANEKTAALHAAQSLRYRFGNSIDAQVTPAMIMAAAWAITEFSCTPGFEIALLDHLELEWTETEMGALMLWRRPPN